MRQMILLLTLIYGMPGALAQPFQCGATTVSDIDGNIYHTVQIGSQCWMKENMRTTRYANGLPVGIREIAVSGLNQIVNTPGWLQVQILLKDHEEMPVAVYDITGRVLYRRSIACKRGSGRMDFSIGPTGMYVVQIGEKAFKVAGSDANNIAVRYLSGNEESRFKSDTIMLSDTSRNYFDYGNDPAMGIQFGKLYTARSALNMDGPHYPETIQGICPDGWHVANDTDWMQLEMTAGMTHLQTQQAGVFRGTIARKLMISGQEWNGTDNFGFSARGSGLLYCNLDGCFFDYLGDVCYWWTYNKDISGLMDRGLNGREPGVWRGFYLMPWAISVRCVKNQ